jgi:MoaA/NifB/PqqE/SkfB family radical SAM enzyme
MTLGKDVRAAAALGTRVLASRLSPRRPFKITLVLTDRCDCRCEACFIWQRPKGRELTPEEIGRFLAPARSIAWVNLTGGEIFLRDDVADVARAVLAALPHLAVLDFPTTGQRTDRILADVAEIATLGIPRLYVTVSLEGPPDLHDRLRGRPGAFDRMAATYAGLREIPGVRAVLGMTLSDRNEDAVVPALEALRARGLDVGWRDLHLNVYTASGHYYQNLGGPLARPRGPAALEQALAAREASGDPADAIEAAYLRHVPEHLRTGRSPLPCQSLRASVFVSAAGDLYPCTVYGRRLGNVLERPLLDLLGAPEAEDARRVIAEDRCPGCWSPCEAAPTILAGLPASLLTAARR